MGKTSYQLSWERAYPWIKAVKGDQSEAFCKLCLKSFSISGSGEAQVKPHAKSKSHNHDTPSANQSTFVTERGKSQLFIPTKIMLSSKEQVISEEVLQALQVANSDYSFVSSDNDNERFKVMFPDPKITQSYCQTKTKVRYNIQYGIAPYVKQMLIYDVSNTPFPFKFDESTSSQVKKQYDAFIYNFGQKNMMK